MYEKYPLICLSAFCFCIYGYLFSPPLSIQVPIQEVSAQEAPTATGKTATGVSMEIQTGGKEDTAKSRVVETNDGRCDAECKKQELIRKGIRDEIAESLVINCKALTDDPVKCIKIGASIVKNESGGGYKCKKANKYNCFGINVKAPYTSYNDGVLHFIGKYNKWWYKAQNMSFFYSPRGKLPPSRYCTSETSSNTSVGCPNGLKISSGFFNSLPF